MNTIESLRLSMQGLSSDKRQSIIQEARQKRLNATRKSQRLSTRVKCYRTKRNIRVDNEDFEYFKSQGGSATTKQGQVFSPLVDLEEEFKGEMIRVHNSWMVRPSAVLRIEKVKLDKRHSTKLILECGISVPVSRRNEGLLAKIPAYKGCK